MDALKNKIHKQLYDKLLQSSVDSPKCILQLTNVELQEKANITYDEAKSILEHTAEIVVASKIFRALDIPSWSRLHTGCDVIDNVTNGGLPANGISEIYGSSGVGKSQLCMQLAIMVQCPTSRGGLGKGAIYICTEEQFPSKRLRSLSRTLSNKLGLPNTIQFEDNIFVEHLADYEKIRRFLYVRLPYLLSKVPIGLIVIDSIAGAFRSDNGIDDYTAREEELYSIVLKLRQLVSQYDIVVVCTNQVTDNIVSGESEPCLGSTWRNLVTSRFKIKRVSDECRTRVFEVINAPDLPNKSASFVITESGLEGVD